MDRETEPGRAEVDARFAEARRLLSQGDSYAGFERGVALIEQAAQDGDAEATCMVAALEAIGAGRERNWDRAFDKLELAASRGSQNARGQLRLLARCGDEGGEDWRALRRRIDLSALLSAPQRTTLSSKPPIRVIKGFATPAECRWTIDRLSPRLAPAMIWDEESGSSKIDPRRSSSAVELRLAEMDVAAEILRARISAVTGLPEFIFEIPQVMHYSVGQQFVPHHDFLDPAKPGLMANIAQRGQRILTFLIYLNEDFEGGETEFPLAGISWRGATGDALAFSNVTLEQQPDPLTLHAGRPPTRGEKWIFSQWVRDRAPASTANAAR